MYDTMNGLPTRPWVRSGVILGVVDFLRRNQYEPGAIVGDSAMRMVEAADPYRQVDLLTIMSIFSKVVDATGRPDMGLQLGRSVELPQLGPFGHLYRNAPTVGAALVDFIHYAPVFQSQAHFALKRGKRRVSIEYASNHVEIPGWEYDSEITVAYIIGICSNLLRRNVIPEEVHFDHMPVCSDTEYRRHLHVRPRFGQSINRVYFSLALMDEPVYGSDPTLYTVLRRHMRDLAEALPEEDNLIELICNNIRRGLGSDSVTLEHIASEVGIEPRTLQRRLGEHGTSFNMLFDQIRLDLARYYLEKTSLDMTEIGLEIGFAGASAFSRAFKRWTGTSPDAYRRCERAFNAVS